MKTFLNTIIMLITLGIHPAFTQDTPDNFKNQHLPQISLHNYFEVVKSNATGGITFRDGEISMFSMKNFKMDAGFLFSLSDLNSIRLSGIYMNFGTNFRIKKVPFEVALFFRHNPFSRLIHDINLGLTLGYTSRHFLIKVGYNYHIFLLTNKSIMDSKMINDGRTYIVEPRNFMYSFTYSIKANDHKWNASFSLTNFDYFTIEHETNPMGSCRFSYRFNPRFQIYSELWYQPAGLTNLQSSFFGIKFRTGLVWKIY